MSMNSHVPPLAIIGSGNIGSAVARLSAAAGLPANLSNSRGPASLKDLVESIGAAVAAETVSQAVEQAEVVVLAVPFAAVLSMPHDQFDGKILIDATNYYPDRDGEIAEFEGSSLTSSELVQQHFSGARVVKGLNNVDFVRLEKLARPIAALDRSALPLFGDDEGAKREASELITALGFEPVDLGALAEGWRAQPGTPVYVQAYLPERPAELTDQQQIYAWFASNSGVTVTASQVRELASQATR